MAHLQEQERERLGFDLHDGIAPLLATIRLQISKGRKDMDPAKLTEAEDRLVLAISELRSIVRNLTPRHLSQKGLPLMLEELFLHYEKAFSIPIAFHYSLEHPLPEKMMTQLYRVIQEAVHNALAHSEASCITVRLKQVKKKLYLICQDDGKGIDAYKPPAGIGLNSLRLRTAMLDGHVQCTSRPGKGTTYLFTIPLLPPYATG